MDLLGVLPLELVHCIVSQVEEKDELLALRLTCKLLGQYAAAFAFRDLDIWLQKDCLCRLLKVAKTPHLARHVNHISCGMEEFYDVDFYTFSRYIFNNRSTQLGLRRVYLPDDMQTESDQSWEYESFDVYSHYALQQDYLRSTRQDMKWLAQAFKLFPALDSVQITDPVAAQRLDPRDAKRNQLKILKQQPLLLPHMFEPLCTLTPRGKHQLETVISTLAKSSTQLRVFTFDISTDYLGGPGSPLSPFEHQDHAAVEFVFRSLRTKYLDISGELHSSSYAIEGSQCLSFTKMLHAMKELKDLSLMNLHGIGNEGLAAEASFESIMQSARFEQLQRLYLYNLSIDESVLSAFISLSCTRLRELRISTALLLSGSWTSFFSLIRQRSSLMVCEMRYLRFDYGGNYSRGWSTLLCELEEMDALSNYLCKRSDVDPWPEMLEEDLKIMKEDDSEDEETEGKLKGSQNVTSRANQGDLGN